MYRSHLNLIQSGPGVNRLSGARIMAHIEIWKSKPEWNQASADERNQVQHDLDELVRRHLARQDGTCGPFTHCIKSGCTLIWEVSSNQAGRLKRDYDRILGRLFVQIMSGQVEGLTARDYADRISKQH